MAVEDEKPIPPEPKATFVGEPNSIPYKAALEKVRRDLRAALILAEITNWMSCMTRVFGRGNALANSLERNETTEQKVGPRIDLLSARFLITRILADENPIPPEAKPTFVGEEFRASFEAKMP